MIPFGLHIKLTVDLDTLADFIRCMTTPLHLRQNHPPSPLPCFTGGLRGLLFEFNLYREVRSATVGENRNGLPVRSEKSFMMGTMCFFLLVSLSKRCFLTAGTVILWRAPPSAGVGGY